MDVLKTLSEKEKLMYETIQRILYNNLSIKQAAIRLGVCEKTIRRNLDIYLKLGAGALRHKSRGRIALNRTSQSIQDRVIELYENTYAGYNFTHFYQKITEFEAIKLSYPTIYHILTKAGYTSPKARRHKKKECLHPIRDRRKAFGELVQMDASKHNWFEGVICHLHLAIDDATSCVLGAHFEMQETLHGYYKVFAQILKNYGVPEEFYTDRRTVFCSKNTKSTRLEYDSGTQFRLAAHKLGVLKIHTSSIPQAKGRVERCFQTFQDRLISEMRTAKITTIDQANAFLPDFIADHNARYALNNKDIPNVFFKSLENEQEINLALSVVCQKTVMNGSCISHKQIRYMPTDGKHRILIKGGTIVYMLHSLDDKLYLVHKESIYPLITVENLELPDPDKLKGKIYIPPKDHPWKERPAMKSQ